MTDDPNVLSEAEEWLYLELKALRDAVIEMRHQQQSYFKSRSQDLLIKAKEAERKVDSLLHFDK